MLLMSKSSNEKQFWRVLCWVCAISVYIEVSKNIFVTFFDALFFDLSYLNCGTGIYFLIIIHIEL